MVSKQPFQPDWASPPGETMSDILRERGLSLDEFVHQMGDSRQKAEDLLSGRVHITIETARRLGDVLGATVEFWMSRDYQYREDHENLKEAANEWLGELPVGDMIEFGWLAPRGASWDKLTACLEFFRVPTLSAWREKYARLHELAVFRTSKALQPRLPSVAAWLRQGEIEAEKVRCGPWDADKFHQAVITIRGFTRIKDPARFLSSLRRMCAEAGVAVVIVRAPEGCPVSGATRFVPDGKAVLQLSFRFLTDDHFWFTFFHEAGHLLLHGIEGFFLEGDGSQEPGKEREANEFASLTLIPVEYQGELLRLGGDWREVVRFAGRVGTSPGIVVGQLQHLRRLRYNQMRWLKRGFRWEG